VSDERTEKATPKRRNKARDEGQVSKSQELNMAIVLMLGLLVLLAYIPYINERFTTITVVLFKDLNPDYITRENIFGFIGIYASEIFNILLPIMAIMVVAGIAVNLFQVGPLFTIKALQPQFSKLSPASMIKGFGRFFNLKSFVELAKSIMKLFIVGGIGYSVIDGHRLEFLLLLGAEPAVGMSVLGKVMLELIIKICVVLLVLGIIDRKYQDYEYDKSLKMTKQEVKDEHKNAEGDPKIKAKIRKQQMQFAMQRMMSAVPSATAVVTNPTHYAVALRYDTSKAPAPQVVAKGVDFVAFKIKEIAQANNVPIVENPPLARTLYKIVPLDGIVPAELYVAVAEVLAYVFRTNKRKKP
jgi:flagellar biosynthetic protein FlhB